MKRLFSICAFTALFASQPVQGQTTRSAETFASENAILDTAIPFAIGAREAQQNLRGSFGWSTFQEGLVEGVYFRFDPDGYGRFSKSPRLDSDVFEVVCRPRTYSCMGRKGAIAVILTDTGKVQLKIEDVQQGDELLLMDGVGEIALPQRILAPLEIHFETLLSAGGDLVVRRGENQINKTPLAGFAATVAYLRWVTARQDYSVLPRTWPVPNSKNDPAAGSITQALSWDSPMPQPQAIQNVSAGAQYIDPPAPQQFDQVKSELAELKEILEQRQNSASPRLIETPAPTTDTVHVLDVRDSVEFQELKSQYDALARKLDMMNTVPLGTQDTTALENRWTDLNTPVTAPTGDPELAMTQPLDAPNTDIPKEVNHLSYLMKEMGLDAKTAIMFLQMVKTEKTPDATPDMPETQMAVEHVYHNNLAASILSDLEKELEHASNTDTTVGLDLTSENIKKSEIDTADHDQGSSSDMTHHDIANLADADAQPHALIMSEPVQVEPLTDTADMNETAAVENSDFQPLTDYFQSVLSARN